MENKGGGGGLIGVDVIVKVVLDGYMIGIVMVFMYVVNLVCNLKFLYDLFKDFKLIINLVIVVNVIVVNLIFLVKNYKEFVVVLMVNFGKYLFVILGICGIGYMLGEEFKVLIKI